MEISLAHRITKEGKCKGRKRGIRVDMAQTHIHLVLSMYLFYSTPLAYHGRHVCSWQTIADVFVLGSSFRY